ncbi:MAG: right-handed parallel beta-helix repeat-containing protein, partial [Bacteroidales bacterium]|nr:right-handed parallel beta-helix repeat-containing protein [Bacteroidales bacterium]
MINRPLTLILFATFLLFFSSLRAQKVISLDQDLANGEDNFANVEPGDTVFLESGERGALILMNFKGTADKPVVFIPDSLGQLRISGSSSYGISIRNCSFIRLSGYKGSDNNYGIKIFDVNLPNSIGVGMSDRSSDVEIDHIEISSVGFAGILAKTEPVCGDAGTQRGGFVQRNTSVHHCHIYETGGEGLYIGSTNFKGQEMADCGIVYPIVLEGVEVHDNLIESTGWDGIQISSAVADCHIFNNRLID